MPKTFSKFSKSKSKSDEIVIPANLIAEMEAIPDKQKHSYPEWHDKFILQYAETKTFEVLGRALGRSESAVRERYKKLINIQNTK